MAKLGECVFTLVQHADGGADADFFAQTVELSAWGELEDAGVVGSGAVTDGNRAEKRGFEPGGSQAQGTKGSGNAAADDADIKLAVVVEPRVQNGRTVERSP